MDPAAANGQPPLDTMPMNGDYRRARLADAKLLLIFTPDLAQADPMAALSAALPYVDIVQVRPKPLGDRGADAPAAATVTSARAAYDWCQRVLNLRISAGLERPPLVFVNDRVDVAKALAPQGLDGVHLGTDDMPATAAREVLGEELMIGLSSHTSMDLGRAWDEPIDMLGFGPIFSTATKGYGLSPAGSSPHHPKVVGPDLAWIAMETAPVPVFPIGGIDLSNVYELERAGRAAVGSAILGADDPARAAQGLRAALEG